MVTLAEGRRQLDAADTRMDGSRCSLKETGQVALGRRRFYRGRCFSWTSRRRAWSEYLPPWPHRSPSAAGHDTRKADRGRECSRRPARDRGAPRVPAFTAVGRGPLELRSPWAARPSRRESRCPKPRHRLPLPRRDRPILRARDLAPTLLLRQMVAPCCGPPDRGVVGHLDIGHSNSAIGSTGSVPSRRWHRNSENGRG